VTLSARAWALKWYVAVWHSVLEIHPLDAMLKKKKKKKKKESRNRPGVAQRIPGGLGSQIFMTFST
jgi:hypothetical protein